MKLTEEQKEKIYNALEKIRDILYHVNQYMENFMIGLGIFVGILVGLLIVSHFLFGWP
jgi:hypothetical protein